MTLATKNGSLIVKDGQIAENCGCCGGWYCCRELPTTCGGAEYVKSASVVVVTGADYVKVEQSVNRGPDCAQSWSAKAVSITPSSHYAGTFQLSRSGDNEFRYDYPPDDAGCAASIVLAVINRAGVFGYSFAWRLELIHHAYVWQKNAPTLPSETKSLSQMQCSPPTPPTLQGCYPSPVEWYRKTIATTNTNTTSSFGPVSGWGSGSLTLAPDGVAPSCPPTQTMSYSGGLAAEGLVAVNDGKSGSGTPIDIVSESGSLAYAMQLEIQTS
jgi:hypothetical protein